MYVVKIMKGRLVKARKYFIMCKQNKRRCWRTEMFFESQLRDYFNTQNLNNDLNNEVTHIVSFGCLQKWNYILGCK